LALQVATGFPALEGKKPIRIVRLGRPPDAQQRR
jgi:hypothetical protein